MRPLSTLLATTWLGDGSGIVFPEDLTSTHLSYLVGVTSSVQGQLDGKSSVGHDHAGVYALIGHNHVGVYEPFNPDLVESADLETLNLNGGYF